ncbi:hypothetical protein [Luteimonas sp. YGD11-2]|uniref:hypothetical protein n=1 Tax=Luteimonas sp. YGD11-2 TaxID=2508168 RepID=UPI00100BE301|nr:hypothetical protein [Luteimonas sp. YGD11-2]
MTSITEPTGDKACPWDTGELGLSVEHARPTTKEHAVAVDDALGLQLISIRLPKRLIDDLKLIAGDEGLGYQPLIRRVLMRFAAAEFRSRAHEELVSFSEKAGSAAEPDEGVEPARRAACG